MNFNRKEFTQEYDDFIITLLDKSLNDRVYNYVSSTYLRITILSQLIDFEKKYVRKNNLYDIYSTNEELKEICSRYHKTIPTIVLNYFQNQLQHPKFSTIKPDFFYDIKNSLDVELKSHIQNHLKSFNELDQKLITECNKILTQDLLKIKDIYTLRRNVIIEAEKWLSMYLKDYDDTYFSTVTSKIDNIVRTTLYKFEEENKNYKQLFDYISINEINKPNEYILIAEKEFKEKLLPLIHESNIDKAIEVFKERFGELTREIKIEPLGGFEKMVIKKLNEKHIQININPDEFDI
jgi:hypothetical protein